MSAANELIKSVFETRFEVFLTPQIIKLLYRLSIIVLLLVGVGAIITGFSEGVDEGIIVLITIPFIYFFVLLYLRVICEFVIVVFNIEANTRQNKSP